MGRFRPNRVELPRYESGVAGLPARAMAFTNSEVGTTDCSLRWWFSYGCRLGGEKSSAMYFGSLMHEVLEDIFSFWRDNHGEEYLPSYLLERRDKSRGILQMIYERELFDTADADEDAVTTLIERLKDCAEGYLRVYGKCIDMRVLAVETSTAMPVVDPTTGKILKSQVPIVEDERGWRLALPGEPHKLVSLPWYKVGRLDAVVMDDNGDLWIWEFKTSKSATTYGKNLALDTQLPGYALSLEARYKHAQENEGGGIFPPECTGRVAGYIWDVLGSNEHKRPKRLKSGLLSTAENRVPSWIWLDTMLKEQANRDQYKDEHWEKLCAMQANNAIKVDTMLYHRSWGSFTQEDLHRYAMELHAKARMIASMRRAVARGGLTAPEVAADFPRTPVCRLPGGYCNFTSICINDSPEGRQSFTQNIPTHWPSESVPVPTHDEEDEWAI